MKITVVGSGGWGTALALLLVENGHDVTLWSHTPAKAVALEETRENPMLKGVPLPPEMKFTADLGAVKGCGAVVMATPSYAVRETAHKLRGIIDPGTVVISVSKGIEKDSSLRLSQVIEEELEGKCPVVVLSGPSHAEEVGRHIPTGVVAAADNLKDAELVQDLFMNPRFRVYTSDDRIGTEICAALKNVIALCAGCTDGMGCGDNTKALLMTRGLAEMARLGVALGGRKETFTGLAGVGDLIVTCTSMHSRNRRYGILIGQGKSVQDALEEIGAVVEGYYAAANARSLAQKVGVEMPISQAAYEVLYNGRDVHAVVSDLMSRAKRSELDESPALLFLQEK
ncbi:NAD(P)H-dependent glycerol-3-phosphate dehydrogenase [Pseudoflavonifractor phocaeensis]|uniref:NAD(P)H-dependent glycerol-3-phosphate dehydrogenase n=1 Tax=Pseudoflavonifractor phocaeensis TaxID=1870988 RepID=UPI0025A464AC|nr:NAD(P)H-dependent glycerol-3-phosphate dehydrogenase [Pseudoflavonifractor phocaeensis]MDM8237711.1 NAD(P)H-dependent glycerol-3-phosphate dehydrogenase [Pseudoflavonifractor phocaeensis]